jgi:hypothetical protein
MGAMSKAGYDNSLGLIAESLRDEWSELVAAPLPERLRRLVERLQDVEGSARAIVKQEERQNKLLNTCEPTDEAKQLLDDNQALGRNLCEKSGRSH